MSRKSGKRKFKENYITFNNSISLIDFVVKYAKIPIKYSDAQDFSRKLVWFMVRNPKHLFTISFEEIFHHSDPVYSEYKKEFKHKNFFKKTFEVFSQNIHLLKIKEDKSVESFDTFVLFNFNLISMGDFLNSTSFRHTELSNEILRLIHPFTRKIFVQRFLINNVYKNHSVKNNKINILLDERNSSALYSFDEDIEVMDSPTFFNYIQRNIIEERKKTLFFYRNLYPQEENSYLQTEFLKKIPNPYKGEGTLIKTVFKLQTPLRYKYMSRVESFLYFNLELLNSNACYPHDKKAIATGFDFSSISQASVYYILVKDDLHQQDEKTLVNLERPI